ncbi:MAG: hypothetical protein AB7F35_27000 [Acetobacteraceae bacterium]
MRRFNPFWTGILVLSLVVPAGAALGQNIIFDAPGLVLKKPPPPLPDVKAAPLAWPRLDPGAAFCQDETDLERLTARRRGEDAGPAACRIVSVPTAVTIIERAGLGRTKVRLTDAAADVTGWTDVWLPERAPGNGAARTSATQ